MDKKLKIIGVMTFFMISFQAFSQASFDDFMSPLDSYSKGFDVENLGKISFIEGDANRLIEGMGEIPSDLVDSYNWYNPVKYLSAAGSYFTYYTTNNANLRYHNKQVYTAADFAERKKAWLKALNTNYSQKFNSMEELIEYLTVDINALKSKKNMAQDKNLKEYLDRMVFTAQEGLERFIQMKNRNQEKMINQKFDQLLVTYMPSALSKRLLDDSKADAEQGLNLAILAKDELSITAHKKIIEFLDDVARQIMILIKSNSLDQALLIASEKLKALQRSKNSSGGNAFDGQIKLYQAVIAALQAEEAQEMAEIAKLEKELLEADKIVDAIVAKYKSVRQAHAYQQEELLALQLALQRLESLRSSGNKKEIEAKKLDMKKKELVLQRLDLKLKEEEENEARQDRKVNELVDKLLIKYNYNISKALTEALANLGSATQSSSNITKTLATFGVSGQSSSLLITNIKNKKDKYEKLSDNEKVVLVLHQKLEEEKLNDSFNIALKQLSTATVVDVPQALEAVIASAFSKAGISIDRLDIKTRQTLADDLKFTSAELIKIMENQTLSEQQKQLEKQTVVKAMLNRNSLLLASGVTGASRIALETGDLQTIATDIALNKLVNTLVPTTAAPTFDLSAMNY